jgi:hypothetical protein
VKTERTGINYFCDNVGENSCSRDGHYKDEEEAQARGWLDVGELTFCGEKCRNEGLRQRAGAAAELLQELAAFPEFGGAIAEQVIERLVFLAAKEHRFGC